MNDHGFVVCAYNRTAEKVDKFLANEAKGLEIAVEASTLPCTAGTKIVGAHSIEEMVSKLKKPRRVMMLVCEHTVRHCCLDLYSGQGWRGC